jgi:hypothetical protein
MTRQEAINTGKGLARTYLRKGGAAFLAIGRWDDNGEYWCQGGAPTKEAARRIADNARRDPYTPAATFEIVAI